MKKQINSRNVRIFQPEFIDVLKRLKSKDPLLEELLKRSSEREEKPGEKTESR